MIVSGPPPCEGIGILIGALLGDVIGVVSVAGVAEVLGFRPRFFFSIGPEEGVVVGALVVGVEVEGRATIGTDCTGA